MYHYRAKNNSNIFVYGYPIIVPELPFPAPPPGIEPTSPNLIAFMYSNDIETYRDAVEYEKTKIQKNTIQYCIGSVGKNSVILYEGDVITATIYPYQNFNALIIWNDIKKSYMTEYHRKASYTGRGIFDRMQKELEYLQNANIDVIGNNIDNADLIT